MFITISGSFRLNSDHILAYEPCQRVTVDSLGHQTPGSGSKIMLTDGQSFVARETPEELDAILSGRFIVKEESSATNHQVADSSSSDSARSKQSDNAKPS